MTPTLRRALLAALLAAGPLAASAGNGAYLTTPHGNPITGLQRIGTEPPGECSQCHYEHASQDGVASGGPFPYALFASNDNQLCFTCHSLFTPAGVYQGTAIYNQSLHGTSSAMVWPGPLPPARPLADGGKCVNCHNPHGVKDGAGVIPSMVVAREENSCIPCHDGSPALVNVYDQFRLKPFKHPIATGGIHRVGEGLVPGAFGTIPTSNRHSECVDCHNPHYAKADPAPPIAPSAWNSVIGVSRIRVTNGPAGSRPLYAPLTANDTTFVYEFEVCFKCHSSWTTQPAGQSDHAVLFNPQNPSFHPVEAVGKNLNISPLAFVTPWSANSTTYCSDCHRSDDTAVKGPHGSAWQFILKKNSPVSTAQRAVGGPASSELCFDCHSYDVYANAASSQTVQGYSRFNPPRTSQGHVYHVVTQRYSCYNCHQSHASTAYPALMVVGRTPGVRSYSQTTTGGSCTPSCHGSETYTANYAR